MTIYTSETQHASYERSRNKLINQQLNAIKEELGDKDDPSNEDDDVVDLTKRLKEANLSPEGKPFLLF